jgi:DMSO/TMAO reductase YedYZ molybdopterin-dependent catalytic subunit
VATSIEPAGPARSGLAAVAAGVVGAGCALATVELTAAIVDRTRPSLIGAVASRLVVWLAGPLKGFAIRTFGQHDKTALVVGIVVVALAIGAVVGLLGRRSRVAVVVVFAGFALVGVMCAAFDPLASISSAVLTGVLGAAVGSTTTLWLLDADVPRRERSAPGAVGRRQFVAIATLVVVAVGAASVGRWLRSRVPAASAGRRGTLPPAERATAIPAAASLPVDGLTPYVTSADRFYRIDTATFVPVIDVDTWELRVTGMVDRPATYSYDELLALGLVDEPVTLACVSNDVGGHLIGNGRWRGVPLQAVLGPAGVRPDATQLVGRSVDGFTVGVPTAVALDGRVAMVAVGLDDDVLADTHGFPARLLVAGLYGYASATKWLRELQLTRLEDVDSFWVARGWDRNGTILTQTRIDVPASGAWVPPGSVIAAGVAWAPPTGVAAVEVQLDRGDWQPARLAAAASTNTWVQWTCRFADVAPGQHLLAARATDRRGQVQTSEPRPAEPSGATGYPYRGFFVGDG